MSRAEELERQVRELVRAGDVAALRALRDRIRDARTAQSSRRAVRYLNDPQGWAREVLDWPRGQSLTGYQGEIIAALPVRRRVAVRGPHGLGKTGVAAIAVLWFATTREAAGLDWKVICTASAWRHLTVYLFPEVHKWARRIRWDVLGRPPFSDTSELLALNLKLEHGAASAVASNKPELIEGAHADSLLYVIDEAKVVPNATWDAIEGAFSGGRPEGYPEALALAISTPGPPAGRFYDIHARKAGLEDWWVRHVTVDEAIAAGRISPQWQQARRRQWGADSALYANRVLGEFHASDEDSVIPLAWVEAAVERWHAWRAAGCPPPEGLRVIGVDVARGGADATVLAHRQGPVVVRLEEHERADTMRTVARVLAARGTGQQEGQEEGQEGQEGEGAGEGNGGAGDGTDGRDDGRGGGGGGELEDGPAGRAAVPVVDSIGVGGGVVDRLRELRVPVIAYTGSAKTPRRTRDREHGFYNLRSEAYWRMRELLDPAFGAVVMLPPDDQLLADLTTPTWDEVSGVPPKIRVEPKEELIARLGRSPDRGDAVAMAFMAEVLGGAPRAHSPARRSWASSLDGPDRGGRVGRSGRLRDRGVPRSRYGRPL